MNTLKNNSSSQACATLPRRDAFADLLSDVIDPSPRYATNARDYSPVQREKVVSFGAELQELRTPKNSRRVGFNEFLD